MGREHNSPSYVVSIFMVVFLCLGRVLGESNHLQVPCYFIFGDSLVDSGNNNDLDTLVRANFPPYGVDFPGGATGRFTNGQTTADIIGQLLGFNTSIQPFANISHNILRGVNYASAGAGIRNESGWHLGPRISLDGQLKNHETIVAKIIKIYGIDVSGAKHLLRRCLYSMGIGSSDYVNNYYMPCYYSTKKQYTPEEYSDVLIRQYSFQIKRLYESGARKVALWGLGPIGCAPYELVGRPCDDDINAAVQTFNMGLQFLVKELNWAFNDARFTYFNTYDISMDILMNSSSYGFKIADEACCRVGRNNARIICLPLETPCPNRTDYVFWDALHPTETANKIIAKRAYNASTKTDCIPFDIKTLVKLLPGK